MNLGNQVKQVMMCIEQKVYFDKKTKIFPEISCRFRDFVVPLPSLKDSGRPLGRAHVRRSALSAGHFLCQEINR